MNVPVVDSNNYWQMVNRCDYLIDILNANVGIKEVPKEIIEEASMLAESIDNYEKSVYFPSNN